MKSPRATPGGVMDVYEFALMAQNTVKPIVAWAFSEEGLLRGT